MTDDQLVDRALAGDVQAFNTLVWRWQKPIYNFTLRYLGNADDARDITQRTFIKAYRKLKSLRDGSRFHSWLFQIALNLCRDESKHRRRKHQLSLDALEEAAAQGVHLEMAESAPAAQPESQLQQNELKRLLQKALDAIPEEQKTVVILKELQGFKFTEIAEMLGISVNTAKSRMYYGLNALRKVFDQWQLDKEAIHYEL